MSESMVERVAKALVRKRVELEIEADGFAVPTNPDYYADLAVDDADRAEARAAILAMRKPTEAMLEVAADALFAEAGRQDARPTDLSDANDMSEVRMFEPVDLTSLAAVCMAGMLDAALTEPTP